MPSKETIKIVDFTLYPGGRYKSDGPGSGEEFRDRYIAPALLRSDRVTVDLGGAPGLPVSFLEEAFGGLVRRCGFSADALKARIEIVADPEDTRAVWQFIGDSKPAETMVELLRAVCLEAMREHIKVDNRAAFIALLQVNRKSLPPVAWFALGLAADVR